MATVEVVVGDLIEETLHNMYSEQERPRQTTVGSNALTSSSDTTLTLADPDFVDVTTRLEVGSEILLVTAKSDDATPVYTVQRAYAGSPAEDAAPTGTVALIEPRWPRHLVYRWLKRSLGVLNTYLPQLVTLTVSPTEGEQFVDMPSDTVRVLEIRHLNTITGRIAQVGGWRLEQNLPDSLWPTGKALRLPAFVTSLDEVMVTYQIPWAFSNDTEEANVHLPLGGEDLPALWVAAYAMSRREVSRSELDRIEEWNQEQAIRAGVNLRLIRDMWGEFYRRLDEVRKTYEVPRVRPFRRMAKGVW